MLTVFCFADVGGGAVRNDVPHSLARIPLRWMIRECFASGSGIQFEADNLRKIGLDPTTLYDTVKPRPPPLPALDILAVDVKAGRVTCAGCGQYSDEWLYMPPVDEKQDEPEYFLSEEHADLHDAVCPIFNMLYKKRAWWILEFLPLVHVIQDSDGTNKKVIACVYPLSRVKISVQLNTRFLIFFFAASTADERASCPTKTKGP